MVPAPLGQRPGDNVDGARVRFQDHDAVAAWIELADYASTFSRYPHAPMPQPSHSIHVSTSHLYRRPDAAARTFGPLRIFLLGVALLVPLNLPFSLPELGTAATLGWSSEVHQHGDEDVFVVTRTLRHARVAGLQPGDVVRAVNGQPSSRERLAALERQARSGEQVHLTIQREDSLLEVDVPVSAMSASYIAYILYLIALGVGGWLLGTAIVAWRGTQLPNLLLASALLLFAPMAFTSGVQGDGVTFAGARTLWQLQSTAYRFLFPALLLHLLILSSDAKPFVRRPWIWITFYLALACVLGLVTHGFAAPLMWTMVGPERTLRTVVGLVIELLLVGTALVYRPRRGTTYPTARRWLLFAVFCFGVTGIVRSAMQLAIGEHGATHVVTQINAVTLALFPPLALGYWLPPTAQRKWWLRKWTASFGTVALTSLFGLILVGVVATVLNATNRDLGGVEWTLFALVFFAAVIFSPLLRWAHEALDRRMWADWSERAEKIREFTASTSAELEIARLVDRVREELPDLLECRRVDLLLANDDSAASSLHDANVASRDVLRAMFEEGDRLGHDVYVPVEEGNGVLLGALRVSHDEGRGATPPEEALRELAAQGIATALRCCQAYAALRRSQEDLAEAERMASVGSLAGGLAHEIRNPLASLKMGLHLVRRDGVNERRLTRLEGDIRRIDDLIVGLLRFSKVAACETSERLDAREIVAECVGDLRPQIEDRGVVLRETYADTPLPVVAGREQLHLIVSNLLNNALEAVGGSDLIDVHVEAVGSTYADIVVRDTGTGIPAEVRSRIFDRDFTTKSFGTGFGLTLARRETERLGGTIHVEDVSGPGTMLRVRLPLVGKEEHSSEVGLGDASLRRDGQSLTT